jgi:hypothetical protein
MPCSTSRFLGRLVACCIVIGAVGLPLSPTAAGDPGASITPRSLTFAVNQVAAIDIPLTAAESVPCTLERLPGSRAKLLPLLPPDHRELIAECARGRTRVRHAVHGLDLLALIEDADAESSAAATIRAFLDERTVDVAMGSAVSAGPYPIAFDWAIVLDAQSHTVFSFIINCRD